jgi:thiopeptide-type bacteriocin biosynthesis protein
MSRHDWIQVNLALSRERGDALASARAVFAELYERIPAWKRHHAVKWAFFIRKPPDLRLRLLAREPSGGVRAGLKAMLRRLRSEGAVERFFFSVYEPEFRLFGGPAAMRLVHRYFDADSTGWVELDRLAQSGQRTALPADALAVAVINDLFVRTIQDRSEVWDAWRNLAVLTHAGDLDKADVARAEAGIMSPLPSAVSGAEARTLNRYARANRAFGEGLRKLHDRGCLDAGLRGVVAFIAMFHLNRHGFDGPRQAALATMMCSAWDPRIRLHGGAREAPPVRSEPAG